VSAPPDAEPLLSVRDLAVAFAGPSGVVRAVDGVSFDVPRGGAVALVGESGSGKSVTAFSIQRVLPEPQGRVVAGSIRFEGRELLTLPEREMRRVRGGRIGLVFQEPMTSLHPIYTVGAQIAEAIRLHQPVSRGEAKARAIELLRSVGVGSPEERFGSYAHELSGGLRQRVMIAIAIACRPALLVADEPTTALDRVTEAQILATIAALREATGMSLLLVSHDLVTVGELCDDVVVMYAGQVVERGRAAEVLSAPRHPYTRALIESVPPARAPGRKRGAPGPRLPTLEGGPVDLAALPAGCRFAPRCPAVVDRCRRDTPELLPAGGEGAAVRCFVAQGLEGGAP
jgi:oligopeptide/dipeptide ABC transporter ATP-binding protein